MNVLFGRPDIIPISLGYSCHVKVFCDMMMEMDGLHGVPRYPFDWVGTPMWSINDIVENDFVDLLNKDKIKPCRRYVNDPTEFLTHDRYNVVFLHDFGKDITNISEETWKKAQEGYMRRVERWNAVLKSGHSILFIRLEMDKKDRIEYPEFVKERGSDEAYQLQRFAELMRMHTVNCLILFLSTTYPTAYDQYNNICTIQFSKKDASMIISGEHIKKIIQANLTFIRNCLARLPRPSQSKDQTIHPIISI